MSKAPKQPVVKQFMSQVLLSLDEETLLNEAAQFFATNKLTTVPIVSRGSEVVGVLTDFQLLRGLLRSRQEPEIKAVGHIRDELDPVVTVHEDDSIVTAFRLMIQSPNHRIYALHDGKLTGAVSPKDLLLYMSGVKNKADHAMDSIVQRQIETILKELHDTRRLLSDYQQMFHDAPYLIHSVDLEGKIIAANKMIHFVLGYEDGELIGRTIRQLYPPENYRKALEGIETVKNLGFHPLVNVVMVKKDGDLVRVDIASTLRKDDKGHPDGTITVGRLSDSYRMLNFLQRAAQVVNRKVTLKSG
ncbi:MAG: CBS domain-containing protein [Bdellovibrionales bacterium]